ncbi:hypothetical protein QBC40DRAFT_265342 [Triangularia verruculosa]|uniref:Uncharacterized protein n=1 Tax=Triangularia verruculosa TaxID=2587418 RepID=A0AAN7AUT2_9PEZI|nr:hypothetical protein QBC40DRAFT_265342 [Triangularia verruculosa]
MMTKARENLPNISFWPKTNGLCRKSTTPGDMAEGLGALAPLTDLLAQRWHEHWPDTQLHPLQWRVEDRGEVPSLDPRSPKGIEHDEDDNLSSLYRYPDDADLRQSGARHIVGKPQVNKLNTSGHPRFAYPKGQPNPLEKAEGGTWHPKSTGMSLCPTGSSPSPEGLQQSNNDEEEFVGVLRGGLLGGDDGRRRRAWEKMKRGGKKVKAFFTRQPIRVPNDPDGDDKTAKTGKTGKTETAAKTATTTAGTTGATGTTRTTATTENTGRPPTRRGRSESLNSIAVSHSSGGPPIPIRSPRRPPSHPILGQALRSHPVTPGGLPSRDAENADAGSGGGGGDESIAARLRGGAREGDDGGRKSFWKGMKHVTAKAKKLVTATHGQATGSRKDQPTPGGKKTTPTADQDTPTADQDTPKQHQAGPAGKQTAPAAKQVKAPESYEMTTFTSGRSGIAPPQPVLRRSAGDPDVITRAPLEPPREDPYPRPPPRVFFRLPPRVEERIPLTGTGFKYFGNTSFLERFRVRPIHTYPDYAGPPIKKRKRKDTGKQKSEGSSGGGGENISEVMEDEEYVGKGKGKAKGEYLAPGEAEARGMQASDVDRGEGTSQGSPPTPRPGFARPVPPVPQSTSTTAGSSSTAVQRPVGPLTGYPPGESSQGSASKGKQKADEEGEGVVE